MAKRIFTVISIVCVVIVAVCLATLISGPQTYLTMRDDEEDDVEDFYDENLD